MVGEVINRLINTFKDSGGNNQKGVRVITEVARLCLQVESVS